MWVFYIISPSVFIPIPFHKSLYILKGSIVFSHNHFWAKNLAVKGPRGRGGDIQHFTIEKGCKDCVKRCARN